MTPVRAGIAGLRRNMLALRRHGDPLHNLAWWDIYFGIVALAVATLVLVGHAAGALRSPLLVLALVGALAVWYVAFGRRLVLAEDDGWPAVAFQVGVIVLFTAVVAAVGTASFLLFALCPLAYMTLRFGPATAFVLMLSIVPPVVFLTRTGDLSATAREPLPVAVLVAAFSIGFGGWVQRIVRQSEERAALIEELRATRAEVARLSHEAGVAAERQRLSGEIHDTIAQGLSSVVMLMQAATAELDRDPALVRRHLAMAERTARENLAEARALVGALTPTVLTGATLVAAVGRLVDRVSEETGVRGSLSVEGAQQALPTAVEVVLLRAVQESLANARKHATPTEVTVRLRYADAEVALEVHDDGCGFTPAGTGQGYGLAAMRARVEQVGGAMAVDSSPGAGTTVRVEVPL
ncbi:sensor histidine kinase [Micromonospora sp. NPDC048999]|uniref:sensor histidine kinase n=1 Tax=Micromonospora sp. NPDC048999 TaxID=3155391 RepID=UPI00340943DD